MHSACHHLFIAVVLCFSAAVAFGGDHDGGGALQPGGDAALRAFQTEIELQVKETLGFEPGERFDSTNPCASLEKLKFREEVFLHPSHQYACSRIAAASYIRDTAKVMGVDYLAHKKLSDDHAAHSELYGKWRDAACREVFGTMEHTQLKKPLCELAPEKLRELMTTDVKTAAYAVTQAAALPPPQQLRKREDLKDQFAYFEELGGDLNYFLHIQRQTPYDKLTASRFRDKEFGAFRQSVIAARAKGTALDRGIDAEQLRLRYVYFERLLAFYVKAANVKGGDAPSLDPEKCGKLDAAECAIAHDWLQRLALALDKCERTPKKEDKADPLADRLIQGSIPADVRSTGCITRDGFHVWMNFATASYFQGWHPDDWDWKRDLDKLNAMANLLYGQHDSLPPLLAPLDRKDRPMTKADFPMQWAMHDLARQRMGLARAVPAKSEPGPTGEEIAAKLKTADRATRLKFVREVAMQAAILVMHGGGWTDRARAMYAALSGLIGEWGYGDAADVKAALKPIHDAFHYWQNGTKGIADDFHSLTKAILDACYKASGASGWARGVAELYGEHDEMAKAILRYHEQVVRFEKAAKEPGSFLAEYQKTGKAAETLVKAFEDYVNKLNGHRNSGRFILASGISLMPGGGIVGAGILIGATADSPQAAAKDLTVFLVSQLVFMGAARFLSAPLQATLGVGLGKATTGVLAGGTAGAATVTTDSLLNHGKLPSGESLLWGTGTGAFMGLVASPTLPTVARPNLARPLTATEEAFFAQRGMLPASGPKPTLAELVPKLNAGEVARLAQVSPPVKAHLDAQAAAAGYEQGSTPAKTTFLGKVGTGLSLGTLTLAGTQIVATPEAKPTHDGGDKKEGGPTGVVVQDPALGPPPENKETRAALVAAKGLPRYGGAFGEDVVQRIAGLPAGAHWLDSGPGDGQSTLDYFALAPRTEMDGAAVRDSASIKSLKALQKKMFRDRTRVTVISTETPRIPPSGDARLRSMADVAFLDRDPAYGKADVITDLRGLFTRSPEPDVVLRRYLALLKVGGHLYLSSPVLKTAMVQPKSGPAISLVDWMKRIKGIQIIDRTLAGSDDVAIEIRVGQRAPVVPELVFESEDNSTPPKRKLREPR